MHKGEGKLYGDWQALTGVLAGNELPAEVVAVTKLTIGENRYEVNLAGTIDSGSCSIHDDVEPIQLKIVGEDGPNAGKTFLAVLEFSSPDQIRIAYDLSGTEFPSSFEPGTEESSYVATFERC
ncbi:MAG: hypothetical protein AAF958_20430 [Planctomycetota bacterium]